MTARIFVTLKNGVLDPQGKAIQHALDSLHFDGVEEVRVGKVFEIEFSKNYKPTDQELARMAENLLANTVIENYRVEIDEK